MITVMSRPSTSGERVASGGLGNLAPLRRTGDDVDDTPAYDQHDDHLLKVRPGSSCSGGQATEYTGPGTFERSEKVTHDDS